MSTILVCCIDRTGLKKLNSCTPFVKHIVCIIVVCAFVSSVAAAADVATTLDQLAARSVAIQAGTFRIHWGMLTTSQIDNPAEWKVEPGDESGLVFTLAGTEWAKYYDGYESKSVNRDSHESEYWPSPQSDGTVERSLHLKAGKTLASEKVGAMEFFFLEAGTVPWSGLLSYLQSRADDIHLTENVDVDGSKCLELVIEVPPEDVRAFAGHGTNGEAYGSHDSIVVKLYCIPELGHVVRRIDLCTTKGVMSDRMESLDFFEVAEGLYFPKEYRRIMNRSDFGTEGVFFVTRYQLLSAERVNEPVPESEFEIKVAANTLVKDYRPGKSTLSFRLASAVDYSDVDDLLSLRPQPAALSHAPSAEWRWILLLMNGVILMILVIWVYARSGNRRRES